MLLLATPPLDDPNFDRSVVYMMEHSIEGAVGVVLNHPTDEASIDGLDEWMELTTPPAVVFNGGPVQFDALIAIAELSGPARTRGARSCPISAVSTLHATLSTSPTRSAESGCSGGMQAGPLVNSTARLPPARGWCSTLSVTTSSTRSRRTCGD